MTFSPPAATAGLAAAIAADAHDPLAHYRTQFVITDPDVVYFDGNSLGRMPAVTAERVQHVVHQEWADGLIRGWGRGWCKPNAAIDWLPPGSWFQWITNWLLRWPGNQNQEAAAGSRRH
jgi:kynureninase